MLTQICMCATRFMDNEKEAIMRTLRVCLLATLTGVAGAVFAQTAAPLPKSLSGHWMSMGGNTGRTYIDSMSVTFDDPVEIGPVKGRLTSRGVVCGAMDEPLTGTWDGSELRFESQVRPNVNVARNNGDCGTGRITFVLTRKPGQPGFEGESHRDTSTAQITLAP
jgi:hypothetical protein